MPSVTYVPHFSIRWTEPAGTLTKTQHLVDVNVVEHAGKIPSTGHVTATSADQLGPIPVGDRISTSRVINSPESLKAATELWKAVQSSNVRQWLTRADAPGGRLGNEAMEIVISRPGGTHEVYRADLASPPQPIADVISAAGKVIGDLRVGPRFSADR